MTSKTLSQLPSAATLIGNELIFGVQTGNPVSITTNQIIGVAASAAASSAASASAAAVLLTSFKANYLGAFGVNPTLDNSGLPIVIGAFYLNTTDSPNNLYFNTNTGWRPNIVPAPTWGTITGLITSQIDLQAALTTITNNIFRISPSVDFSNTSGINSFNVGIF